MRPEQTSALAPEWWTARWMCSNWSHIYIDLLPSNGSRALRAYIAICCRTLLATRLSNARSAAGPHVIISLKAFEYWLAKSDATTADSENFSRCRRPRRPCRRRTLQGNRGRLAAWGVAGGDSCGRLIEVSMLILICVKHSSQTCPSSVPYSSIYFINMLPYQ